MNNITVSFVGVDHSDALKTYALEKLTKHEELLVGATKIEVLFKENIHSRGVSADFRVDINVYMPNAMIRVEERGSDLYALIDGASDTLVRRLRRYTDRKTNWDGTTPWRVLEANEEINDVEVVDTDIYAGYIPKVVTRKKIKPERLSEGEAIEKMVLMGYEQMLFVNHSTGLLSMVYSRKDGEYGLVEIDE